MSIWAIADLHLSFGVPNKHMDIFGSQWKNYTDKIEAFWRESIHADDLVLIAGDISWAMHTEEAALDFKWIDALPGTKVLIKGNHDYWWGSLSKIKTILPSSCHLIQNNSFTWRDFSIAGARLWDVPGLCFNDIVDFKEGVQLNLETAVQGDQAMQESQKIYQRELGRLEMSLKSINPLAKQRIAMTHYPPIGSALQESEVSKILEKYKVNTCVFGHLHNVKPGLPLFGERNGVKYCLTSCDYLNFKPLKIAGT